MAAALGRHGVGVDLSWDYHRIARWRDRDGGLRAKALGVDRPEKQIAGQLSLLDIPMVVPNERQMIGQAAYAAFARGDDDEFDRLSAQAAQLPPAPGDELDSLGPRTPEEDARDRRTDEVLQGLADAVERFNQGDETALW